MKVNFSGSIVYWSLTRFTDHTKLSEKWGSIGLGNFVPYQRSRHAALKTALQDVYSGRGYIIRPLAQNIGFTVKKEERGQDDNDYLGELIIKVSDDGLEFGQETARTQIVRARFADNLNFLDSSQIAVAMKNVLMSLGATSLRPTGGFYYLPESSENFWADCSQKIKDSSASGTHDIYSLKYNMDENGVRAIRDALIREVEQECSDIIDKMTSPDIGQRAKNSIMKYSASLLDKVTEYEKILQEAMPNLKDLIDQAQSCKFLAECLPTEGE